jgi:alpha-galactosidase
VQVASSSARAFDAWNVALVAGGIPDLGALEFPVPPPSPTPSISGAVEYVSDLEWVDASNGWGPPERDMSNGEKASGDGVTITLNGRTFDRGVGAHAPAMDGITPIGPTPA